MYWQLPCYILQYVRILLELNIDLDIPPPHCLMTELGKVTLKSNGDEALSDGFLSKSNSDDAFNTETKIVVMKRGSI